MGIDRYSLDEESERRRFVNDASPSCGMVDEILDTWVETGGPIVIDPEGETVHVGGNRMHPTTDPDRHTFVVPADQMAELIYRLRQPRIG